MTDGVTTNNSAAMTDTGEYHEVGPTTNDISISDLTLDANPTDLTASVQVSAGSAVVALAADIQLLRLTRALQRIELPQSIGGELTEFTWIHRIYVEESPGTWVFPKDYQIDPKHIKVVDEEGTRYLHILRTDLTHLARHRLMITGHEGPVLLTSNTATTTVDGKYLSDYAAWFVLNSLPNLSNNQKEMRDRLHEQWLQVDRLIQDTPLAGSLPVERNTG